ncbi:hypothetical protein CCYA_CCYA02G0531 [Cyanidiococcus yangmingshanensis]|nr:hypothetical protein CCYA_CCYA02G0531 [Cyanidiococcus yangmingshanensis]
MPKPFVGCDDVDCACLYGSRGAANASLQTLGFTVNETIPCWYNGSGNVVVLVNQGFTYSISTVGLVLLSLGSVLLIWAVLHAFDLDCRVLEAVLRFLCCGRYDEWELRRRRQLWQHTRAYGTNHGGLLGYMLRARAAGLLPEEIREILQKAEISHQELEDLKKRAESGLEERGDSSVDAPLEADRQLQPAREMDPYNIAAAETAAETAAGSTEVSAPRAISTQPAAVGDLADCGICLDELVAPPVPEDSAWEDDQVRTSQLRRGVGRLSPQAPRRLTTPRTRSLEGRFSLAEAGSATTQPAANDVNSFGGVVVPGASAEQPSQENSASRIFGRLFLLNPARTSTAILTGINEPRESDIEAARDPALRNLALESYQVSSPSGDRTESRTALADQASESTGSASRRIVLLKCGHVFHFSCMKHFLCEGGVTCPICNRNIARDYLAASRPHPDVSEEPSNRLEDSRTTPNTHSPSRPATHPHRRRFARASRLFQSLTHLGRWRRSATSTNAVTERTPQPNTAPEAPSPPPRALVQLQASAGDIPRQEPDYGLVMVPHPGTQSE